MKFALRDAAVRHAPVVAALVLVVSVASFVAYLLMERSIDGSGKMEAVDFLYSACQVLPYGLVGAVLVARRPDLPFGWLLSLAAVALAIQLPLVVPSYLALDGGGGGEFAVWGLSFAVLGFLPIALEGLINVRFPSGRPSGRIGRLMDRALLLGIVVALTGGLLGDNTIRAAELSQAPGTVDRFVDGTPVTAVGNAMALATPLVVLLGVLAGLGVVIRFLRAEGLERLQLQWRAVGVMYALVLFPLAVTDSLPTWLLTTAPLMFGTTLVVPVLRYDLWAIDALIRRSAAYTLSSSSGTTVENLVRAVGEMLRLSHVAVLRDEVVLASYGQDGTVPVEVWPLMDERGTVGTLHAAPRHGLRRLDDRDRQVLDTVARLVTEAVRADALTAELRQARNDLISAREEERRRLRRDLHDGVGPLLTGLGLNLDAARSSLEAGDEKAAIYLGQAKNASAQVISDLRGLVHDLRPPALDELGLAAAIQLHAERAARDAGLALELTAPEDLHLAAAVEVATFRTVIEAVNNAIRHSGGHRISVTIHDDGDHLDVAVTDDGTSRSGWHAGVGLSSMRERAEELGGTFIAGPAAEGGRIQVRYPLGSISP